MKVNQFQDKTLSHYSYTVFSESRKELIVIDPARDIRRYLDFARDHGSKIIGVIETHPHADFVSGHLELHKTTGATIYCSKLSKALYPHSTFDERNSINFGEITLKALNTPGHSPDSICIVLEHNGHDKAVFTGDTLFVGDCGRPDLREDETNASSKKEKLAKAMYYSLRDKLLSLDDNVILYPAHGAGTLCGKSLSDAPDSTIAKEKAENWCLQPMAEDAFVKTLTEDQPFIPKYFGYNVKLNLKGACDMATALNEVKLREINSENLDNTIIVIDTRSAKDFRNGHLPNSINIMADGKFETWLGSIITPSEYFYLTAENEETLAQLLLRVAKIGYEPFIKEAFVLNQAEIKSDEIDLEKFKSQPNEYTIVDIREQKEIAEEPFFKNAIRIPLHQLRERINEIPLTKPIVVHCAGGYRSAAGSSIIEKSFPELPVYDLSTSINSFRG